jgi:oxygen-dependent protoporphyrinogen oxidase
MSSALACLAAWAVVFPAKGVEPPFKGERCAECHSRIRDAEPAAGGSPSELLDERRRDVVVVGGGLAGLAAAWQLRDQDVLVLEKEARAGGKVRREAWGRKRYPVAAGYMYELYLDGLKSLFRSLGIEGRRIPKPTNSLRLPDGRIVHEPFGRGIDELPETAEVRSQLKRMSKEMAELSARLGSIPPMPKSEPWLADLDRISFKAYMEKHYGSRIGAFADGYAKSLFGVDGEQVSALAGLVFFTADFGGGANITWDGGPGVIAEKLEARLGRKLELGAFVLSVSTEPGGVRVEYEKAGRRRSVRARAAVLAVPSFIVRRLAKGLPDWKSAALSKVRYSSYALAIIALKEPIYRDSFDLWAGTDTVFTDLSPLDWGEKDAGPAEAGTPAQLLEAYVPLGESAGRAVLLDEPDERMSERIESDLDRLFPGARPKVHGVRLIRWGHAMPVDFPGYLTGPRRDVSRPAAPFFFAGVDGELPCIEGALSSGLRAGKEARGYLDAGAGH